MVLLSQCVGIDISKATFTACLCRRHQDGSIKLSEVVEFSNNKTGYNQLLKWQRKSSSKEVPVNFVMEATGIYYEQLAYHLDKLNIPVSVVLPNKIVHYGKSLNVKTKTDIEDAKVISRFGAERKLQMWTPASPLYKELRSLTRLYGTLQSDKTMVTNRLKQVKCGYKPMKLVIKTYEDSIEKLKKQLKKVEAEMKKLLKSDPAVWSKVENLLKIKGLGLKTIAIILGETQGFKLIKNQRQLVSYCGLDVVERESGSSIKGRTRMSKKGNSHIRAALHFPALVASRYNERLSVIYKRIIKDKSSKMIGMVALQRRLLVLMYSLWKSDLAYQEDYHLKGASGYQEDEVSFSSSTRRVEQSEEKEKVDGATRHPSTQNEPLYEQASEALLRL